MKTAVNTDLIGSESWNQILRLSPCSPLEDISIMEILNDRTTEQPNM
jgi:hypothetical protein